MRFGVESNTILEKTDPEGPERTLRFEGPRRTRRFWVEFDNILKKTPIFVILLKLK